MLHPDVEKELKKRNFINPNYERHDYSTKSKKCSKCKESFPRTNEYFRKDSQREDGLSYLCKKCASEIGKISNEKNKQKIKKYQSSPAFIFSQLKHQAQKRDIPFSITKEYYLANLAPHPCNFCQTENTKHNIDMLSYDHTEGYTEVNTVPCCSICSKVRSITSPDEFVAYCKTIASLNNT